MNRGLRVFGLWLSVAKRDQGAMWPERKEGAEGRTFRSERHTHTGDRSLRARHQTFGTSLSFGLWV